MFNVPHILKKLPSTIGVLTTVNIVRTCLLFPRQHVVTAGHCIKNKLIDHVNVTLGEVSLML